VLVKKESMEKEDSLSIEEYNTLHEGKFIIPLDYKIDIELFGKEIQDYRLAFRRWGEKHMHVPRFGIPLTNLNGDLRNNPEPCCYPLDQWCDANPNSKYSDQDFNVPTELLDCSCFDVINELKEYMIRSCVLYWGKDAYFMPHVDTWLPSKILRLWGTSDATKQDLRHYYDYNGNDTTKGYKIIDNIESGRLYLMDTSLMHTGNAFDNVYQFFIALNVNAYNLLENKKLKYKFPSFG